MFQSVTAFTFLRRMKSHLIEHFYGNFRSLVKALKGNYEVIHSNVFYCDAE
jgi:hypothetical protein